MNPQYQQMLAAQLQNSTGNSLQSPFTAGVPTMSSATMQPQQPGMWGMGQGGQQGLQNMNGGQTFAGPTQMTW